MYDQQRAAWLILVGIVIAIPIINSLLRHRKAMAAAKPLPEDDVRPAHIPWTYSWDDWIRDIYSAGVSTDLIMEKIRWCGMPKRPKPQPITTAATIPIVVEGVSSGTGIGGTYTPTPTWVGGMVIPSTTIDPNPPYYNVSNVSGCTGTYYNAMTNYYPYASSHYNMMHSSSLYGTSSNIMVTSSNMASFTHATFNG